VSRDLVLGAVAFVMGTGSLWLAGWLPDRRLDAPAPGVSGGALERRAWRRLWRVALPALLILAVLLGWGAQEPAQTDEPLRPLIGLAAMPALLLWLRAARRAWLSLRRPRRMPALATVGVVRPRVVMAPGLADALDGAALAAALAHEEAHVRHRDPLRVWLAQFVTDLQWPSPFARRRLQGWRGSLELARDDEARRDGAGGVDLAAAIVAVARQGAAISGAAAAALGAADRFLARRIERLLAPLAADDVSGELGRRCALAAALAAAAWIGIAAGDNLLRALPFIRA